MFNKNKAIAVMLSMFLGGSLIGCEKKEIIEEGKEVVEDITGKDNSESEKDSEIIVDENKEDEIEGADSSNKSDEEVEPEVQEEVVPKPEIKPQPEVEEKPQPEVKPQVEEKPEVTPAPEGNNEETTKPEENKSTILNVPYISQYPNMPLGCEATSLAQLLNYKGVSVSKETIAEQMLKSPNKNPDLGFVGSPYKNESGIFQTIYPAALEQTAKMYRPNSENITGASVETIENEIRKGNPSVIWVSLNFASPQMGNWYEGTSDEMWVNKNLHVVAVTGVDENDFYITDPAKGKYSVSRATFKYVYETVGKKALVVR